MGHLGDDVAAYVDRQLPPSAMARADAHLADCEPCQQAVRQQRALKERMRGTDFPVPPTLVQALGALPTAPVHRHRGIQAIVGAAMVVVGAALAVASIAYTVASPRQLGDPVAPQAEQLASISNAFGTPGDHLDDQALDELDRAGWPSRHRLGHDYYRLDGRMHDGERAVAQMYVGPHDLLVLVEQVGSLDPDALTSWERRTIADHRLWVREGEPRVLTWDADGMVYALVTSLTDGELSRLLKDLPAPEPEPNAFERIGDGLVRMTSWFG